MNRAARHCYLIAILICVSSLIHAQQFKNPRVIPIGGSPKAIALGDFNRDGKADIVFIDSVIHALLGNSDATFQDVQQLSLPGGFGESVTVADVNNDGVQDLLLGNRGPQAQIAVYMGNGDGTFSTPKITSFGSTGGNWAVFANEFGVADLNGDGKPDVIANDVQNYKTYILLGDGQGGFTYKTDMFNGSGPGRVFVKDFNSDGRIDFAVHGVNGKDACVYFGNGDGTFQAGTIYTTAQKIVSMLAADVNRDGRIDFVTTGFDQSIYVLQGNVDGTFTAGPAVGTVSSGSFASLTAVIDIDSDGIMDLVTSSQSGLGLIRGKSDGTFGTPRQYVAGPYATTTVIADFNGDGRLDIAVPAAQGIALLLANADGTLQTADSYEVTYSADGIAIADFNGDHIPDIAVGMTGHAPKILIGKGDGTFNVTSQAIDASLGGNVLAGDFDGNGRQDLFVLNQSDASVQSGLGNGTFGPPAKVQGLDIIGFTNGAAGDFNGDGKTDVLVLNYESFDIVTATSGGNFSIASTYLPGANSFSRPPVGDINGDGKLDFVLGGLPHIYLGNGNGTFTEGRMLWAPLQGTNVVPGPSWLALSDIDSDGNVDVVATIGSPEAVIVYYGLGNGAFEDPIPYATSTQKVRVKVADVNGDGKPDFVVSDNTSIGVLYNMGSREFGSEGTYLAGTNIGEFSIADLNGDGMPDVVVPNGSVNGGATVTVLLNQGRLQAAQGALTVTPEPSVFGNAVTTTLKISPSGTTGTPTGTVVFSVDGVWAATVVLVGGIATYTGNADLSEGGHLFSAAYSGDSHFLATDFSVLHKVAPLVLPTQTTLVASATSARAGTTIRFTASVTAASKTPSDGFVGFADGNKTIGSATLDSSGHADFETALLSGGDHSITATYLGVTHFSPSKSAPLAVAISTVATATSLTASGTAQLGKMFQVTVGVTSSAGSPTGSVTIYDGSIAVRAVSLTSGGAKATLLFETVGSHVLTAVYNANGKFASSSSPATTIGVTTASGSISTTVAISAEHLNPSVMRLRATVNAGLGTPVGHVTFIDGTTPLGEILLSDSSASIVLNDVTPGTHSFRALYTGDPWHAFSSSSVLVESEPGADALDYFVSISATRVMVAPDSPATVDITIAGKNGFSQPVTLSCSSPLSGVSCAIMRTAVENGSGSSKMVVAYQRARGVGATARMVWAPLIFAFVICPAVLVVAPRKHSRRSICITACLILLGLAGCGAPANRRSEPTTTTVSVMATSGTGGATITHSAQVMITLDDAHGR